MQLLDQQSSAPPPATDGAPAPKDRMWEMITAYRTSQVVRAVAQFGVAEHLIAGRRTSDQIADAEALDPDATFRLLRCAASLGLVTSADGDSFCATELLGTLAADDPSSMRGLALALAEPGHWLPWGRLPEAVRTGTEQGTAALGAHLWDYYDHASDEAAHFTAAMSAMTAGVGAAAARALDLTRFEVAADIGGARGSLLHALLEANPHLQGIVFDLPNVVAEAQAAARDRGVANRVTVLGGDFFETVPPADAMFLRYILHDWDDLDCVTILRNCRRAMTAGGRVFVLELVIGELGDRSPAALQDMQMLVGPGGRERTVAEFERLLAVAELRLRDVITTDTPVTILEAVAA